MCFNRGAWVVQSVKYGTLGLCSGYDLRVVRSSPVLGQDLLKILPFPPSLTTPLPQVVLPPPENNTNGQQLHENVINIINHQGNVNQNHNKIFPLLHTCQNGQYQGRRKQVLARMQRKGNPSALLVRRQTGARLWKTLWRFLRKSKMELPLIQQIHVWVYILQGCLCYPQLWSTSSLLAFMLFLHTPLMFLLPLPPPKTYSLKL